MAAVTLENLIALIANRYGHARNGIATGGSLTTLVDTTNLYQPDHTWKGHFCRITVGVNAGLERLVTAFSQASKSLTVDPAWPTAPLSGDQYLLLPQPYQDFLEAVQEATRQAGNSWMVSKVNDTQTFNNTQEYSLPTDLAIVNSVFAGDGTRWTAITDYEVLGNSANYSLFIRVMPSFPLTYSNQDAQIGASTTIRVSYCALPNLMNVGSDTTQMGELQERDAIAFLESYALYVLHMQAISRNVTGEAAKAHLTLAQVAQANAEQIRARIRPEPVTRRITHAPMPRMRNGRR